MMVNGDDDDDSGCGGVPVKEELQSPVSGWLTCSKQVPKYHCHDGEDDEDDIPMEATHSIYKSINICGKEGLDSNYLNVVYDTNIIMLIPW